MVINENNTHINSFTKGMNSDTSYDQMQNQQYVFGKNVRITKNQSLGGTSDYSTLQEGIITPVPAGKEALSIAQTTIGNNETILAVKSVEDLAVIISVDGNDNLVVRKLTGIENEPGTEKSGQLTVVWKGIDYFKGATEKQASALLYKELDNVIKLYIATGITPIIELRVDGSQIYGSGNTWRNVDYLINNRIVPTDRVFISDVIDGRLPASQVQYTYRFYNKYGNATQLAPLTNKIQIIDSSRDKEVGNAEGTETSKGLQITIPVSKYKDLFDRMQVFRLTYIKPNEDSEVSLIYDDEIKGNENKLFVLNDVGIEPLNILTIEEFSAMSGLILIPKHIENNQNYMFCANIQDDTIIKNLYIKNTSLSAVYTEVILSQNCDGGIPTISENNFNVFIKDYESENNVESVSNYFKQRGVNPNLPKSSYNNIFTSSLLRSLRRGETYKYGIIYYDKYGRRSDVKVIGSKHIAEIQSSVEKSIPFKIKNGNLIAQPIGIKIDIPQPYVTDKNGNEILAQDIVGCQIVRRSSSEVYQNALLQVALARPIKQELITLTDNFETTKSSPYYPTGFLMTNDFEIFPSYFDGLYEGLDLDSTTLKYKKDEYSKFSAQTVGNKLFQIFSSEINYRRDDVFEKINTSNTKIEELLLVGSKFKMYGELKQDYYNNSLDFFGLFRAESGTFSPHVLKYTHTLHKEYSYRLYPDEKQNTYWTFTYFTPVDVSLSQPTVIKQIKDVKIPNWSDSFVNIQRNDDNRIIDAIKKYKSFTTTIGENIYNNWVSWCKYDLKAGCKQTAVNQMATECGCGEFLDTTGDMERWMDSRIIPRDDDEKAGYRYPWRRSGYIGPGPSCFLMTTENDFGTIYETLQPCFMETSICNITHAAVDENVQSEEQTIYYGFGNYFKLKLNNTKTKYIVDNETNSTNLIVFDGDIYITPHEFTTLYKTYNFESADTLQSIQITNYIPLESKVNTYFDYGMNLLNTTSANLIYEPGSIEGIATQERPAHQYNMIYSDNDASNDVFTLISTDKDETNIFKQRAYFSEPKTNGEFIDNFQIFKAASFIDVDSKFGPITHLFTNRNALYYWQENAFGKFSVNERSLINDQNGNTIMLGQAGILSRYDYISNKYGMREGDMCACAADQRVFWVDINNKAIVAANGEQAINYGEQLNVQNIINTNISLDIPRVDYDLQNSELLCQCLKENNKTEQLIFNTKYNIATSLYTRDYDIIMDIKNHIFGLKVDNTNHKIHATKYNYLKDATSDTHSFLSPMTVKFVVNPNASITKVFDNQQIVPIKRDEYKSSLVDVIKASFKTDVYDKVYAFNSDMWTDREGNILYAIPRWGNEQYGNRLRGKWMETEFTTTSPADFTTISHVITKFRQSFS